MMEVRPYFTSLLLFSVFFLSAYPALSQTDNYWSWNFNTPSTLLAGAVTNVAIGFKQIFSDSFYLLAGFRTDFAAGKADDDTAGMKIWDVNQIHIDKYHFSLGPVWKFKRYKIVTGLQYSLGLNKDVLPIVNFSKPIEYNT